MDGPLRIHGDSPLKILRSAHSVQPQGSSDHTSSAIAEAGNVYTQNLAKLVPGEAFALHAIGSTVAVPAAMINYQIWPVFCLVAAVIFRWLATRHKGSWKPQWWAVAIAGISFVLWTYGEGRWFLDFQLSETFIHVAKYSLLFWTFVIPAVVGDNKG